MSDHRTSVTKSKFLVTVCVLVLAMMTAQGCITTAVIATASLIKGGKTEEHIATVQVDRSPDDVYDAAMNVLARMPDVKVTKEDAGSHQVDAARGKNSVSIKAISLGGNRSEIIVAGRAGEGDQSPEQLAMTAVETLCKELGVRYTIAHD
ncbi:MAG: hypothetical protein ACYS8X_08380 [Planctomycetota bacterium]|jgi:hypothetical protein